jgi:dihydropteroate synthase
MKQINCKGKLIDLSHPKVMGILNITPDSFYDGGQFRSDTEILKQVELMLTEGATFIDVGAYSSRPNAQHISLEEELARLMPVLTMILDRFPEALLSVDTFRSAVARESIAAGACMINDISAGSMDKNMFTTIASLQVPYIIMHMIGNPQNMQNNTSYKDLIQEIIYYFSQKIFELRKLGVNDLIIDPGFGFSKTLDQNYDLLSKLDCLAFMDLPILTGMSRKSMLYNLLHIKPEEALNATSVVNAIALQKGSSIIRVHDVKEAVQTINIVAKTTTKLL